MSTIDFLSEKDMHDLCAWCFSVLSYSLGVHNFVFDFTTIKLNNNNNKTLNHNNYIRSPDPPTILRDVNPKNIMVPMFVTWMKNVQKGDFNKKKLRGCIGSLKPVSLLDISKYAQISAFHDSRFKPICKDEILSLQCQVSLLYSFERCTSLNDWEIGTHGLIIEFEKIDINNSLKKFEATFLPEVPVEHNMSQIETLQQLIFKAGWTSQIDDELFASIFLQRYKVLKCSMDFNEYSTNYLNLNTHNS